jgi:hypothetical protein
MTPCRLPATACNILAAALHICRPSPSTHGGCAMSWWQSKLYSYLLEHHAINGIWVGWGHNFVLISALDGGDYSVSCTGCFTHEALALPTGLEDGLAPELVRTLWRGEKLFGHARNPTPVIQSHKNGEVFLGIHRTDKSNLRCVISWRANCCPILHKNMSGAKSQ